MKRLLISTFCLASISMAATVINANPIFEELTTVGVPLGDGSFRQLPSPSLPDDVDAAEQQRLLQRITTRHSLRSFLRESRVAPHELKMESIKDESGARIGQAIDVWFVAYGSLEALENEQLLQELGNIEQQESEQDESRELTHEELSQRGVEIADDDPHLSEQFGYFKSPLLNRVQLAGVTRTVTSRGQGSRTLAAELDERFLDDQEFPNQWRSLSRNEEGVRVLGDPQPYAGFGSYIKVTRLKEPEGALLVEMHIVFNEPKGWFGGTNLLRSKLPIAIQENVRRFRDKLRSASK